MKLFDVASFDVIHILKLSFVPSVCEFVHKITSFSPLLAIAEFNKSTIRILNAEQSADEKMNQVVAEITSLHETPVRIIKFNPIFNLVVSTDQSGIVEVWDPET